MPMVWADGGESLCAPADTLPAYWGALGAGADGLALTVQCSKDGKIVCTASDRLGDGKSGKAVDALSGAEIRKVDAGARFRSQAVDGRLRAKGRPGRETPWAGHPGKRDALYHPELDEVLRHFGRRARLLVRLKPAGSGAAERARLGKLVLEVLDRHAVFGRTLLAGDAATIAGLGNPPVDLCLLAEGVAPAEALKRAGRAKAGAVVATVAAPRDVERLGESGIKIIASPPPQSFAFEPSLYRALAGKAAVAGILVRGVTEMQAVAHRHGLVVQDSFAGQRLNADLWTLGHSRNNHDTKIRVDDGLRIDIEGEEYSGASAFSNFSINGDFDARMNFEVANPEQGTTFELAALHVDAGYRPTNLTFDVHGAPPYASSERDENDGFRIGWNNGPALTRWIGNEPQSSNLYNCYGRDVGLAGADSPFGRLRLMRHGQIFNAYYIDRANEGWILSGSVAVPALGDAVFLRLGAKHWPKGGREPPTNHFRFSDFELRQWD